MLGMCTRGAQCFDEQPRLRRIHILTCVRCMSIYFLLANYITIMHHSSSMCDSCRYKCADVLDCVIKCSLLIALVSPRRSQETQSAICCSPFTALFAVHHAVELFWLHQVQRAWNIMEPKKWVHPTGTFWKVDQADPDLPEMVSMFHCPICQFVHSLPGIPQGVARTFLASRSLPESSCKSTWFWSYRVRLLMVALILRKYSDPLWHCTPTRDCKRKFTTAHWFMSFLHTTQKKMIAHIHVHICKHM